MSDALELAEVFPPGEFIKDEMEARGWSQLELAEILGRTPAAINELIMGKRAVTPDTAKALEQALGLPAQFWMNTEARWQLSRARAEDPSVSKRAKLYGKAPVKDMIRRGWIDGSSNADVVQRQILDFYERNSIDEEFVFDHAARKSTSYTETTPAQCAWLFRCKHLARMVSVTGVWKPARLKELVSELRALALSPEAVHKVPAVLASFGIRFVIVELLPQAKLDGASFWLGESEPVIAMSIRYDRIDNFWHTLMHEIAHIANGDKLSIDVDILGPGDKPPAEVRADKFAVESLIPHRELEDFCARVAPLFSERQVRGFAATIEIHPGIVVGQLHHRGKANDGLDYTYFRKMLAPIRAFIIPAALTDGWKKTVSI